MSEYRFSGWYYVSYPWWVRRIQRAFYLCEKFVHSIERRTARIHKP